MSSRIRQLANLYSPAAGAVDDIGPKIEVYALVADLPLTGNDTGARAFCQDVNRLYFWNGSGWYSYSLVDETPTISVDVADNLEIDGIEGTPLVVTVTAEDPEGFDISYSYELTAGTLGGTTVTQADNVFTITPSNDQADGGSITIAFKVADINGNTGVVARTFNIAFLPTLTDFVDARSPQSLILPENYTDTTVIADPYTGTNWNISSGGSVTTNYIDLEAAYMETAASSNTVGQNYTHFYYWRPRVSNTGWRTLYRGAGTGDHWVIVQDGGTSLGMYSNRNGQFRDTGYDITPGEWITLIVVGQGDSATASTGTQTFYVNGVNVGTTDRVACGMSFYRIGWSGQSPGLINCTGLINTAITEAEVSQLHQILTERPTT